MARTPTYTRLNVDEIADKGEPAPYVMGVHQAGSLLLIEDDRAGVTVPDEWLQHADKVVIAGRVLKDNHKPIDPTQRRASGLMG